MDEVEQKIHNLEGFTTILGQFDYVVSGFGEMPNSHRFTHLDQSFVDIRGDKWEAFNEKGRKTHEGHCPASLIEYLTGLWTF